MTSADRTQAPKPARKGTVKKRPEGRQSREITEAFIQEVCERLRQGKAVRRTLPLWGRLHIDRQLPFLCVYRATTEPPDQETAALVVGQASYLVASGERHLHRELSRLVTAIAQVFREAFGSFILLEVWAGDPAGKDGGTVSPRFQIVLPRQDSLGLTVGAFEQALHAIQIQDIVSDVIVSNAPKICPPGLPSLLTPSRAAALGCHVMGIEVPPIYRDATTGQTFPEIHKALRRRLAAACKRGLFDFTRRHTTHRPPHYHALGPRAMVKAVWRIDEQLSQVSGRFDLLLSVTPINGEAAWTKFRKRRFKGTPEFLYRPLPMDPALLKRELYRIPIERIEDPTLADLFAAQQQELDNKITLLADRGTPNFLYSSLHLYGPIPDDLLNAAQRILEALPPRSRDAGTAEPVNAQAFAVRAREEIDYLKLTHPEIQSRVEIRSDIIGLMVSRGDLLVGSGLSMPAARVPAALAHEVGTHILTYINGRAQPFRQLHVGLPGYEELQEGLAVLSEYLVGGLNPPRLRLLAARVTAVRHLMDGASFEEVFGVLQRDHGFAQHSAFTIALRVFRGGGLTKDAIYLRGLLQVFDYLKDSGPLDPLFVGKLALKHAPIIQELQLRRVLGPVPLRPTYLDDPKARERLERVRAGLTLADLVTRRRS